MAALKKSLNRFPKYCPKISHYIGFVLTPELHGSILRRLELIPIDGDNDNAEHQGKVLAVLLMASGVVKNHIVPVSKDLTDQDFRRISRILMKKLVGLSLQRIQQISQRHSAPKSNFRHLSVRLGRGIHS